MKAALAGCWHGQQAENSLLRWLELRRQQGWGDAPAKLRLLAQVFGASWYFTRFVFYRGRAAAALIDGLDPAAVGIEQIRTALDLPSTDDTQAGIARLALVKNEWMLKILLCYLAGHASLQQTEQRLTVLAEAVLIAFFQRLTRATGPLAILAMGRMAGDEMTFGSDLDLIFLYEDGAGDAAGHHLPGRQIQKLLRYLGSVTPQGSLYEVDMRLRPHGTAGALVSAVRSFQDYHAQPRAIWERQLMTRCRLVYDPDGFAAPALAAVSEQVYQGYEQQHLLDEIVSMRRRVQRELGQPKAKYELKRGRGGIMDIDFLCHYFQLSSGHQLAANRTNSTRRALALAGEQGFLSAAEADSLTAAYDYLKTIETALRLWDLKPLDSFPVQHERNGSLALACGFAAEQTAVFMRQYARQTDAVRAIFEKKLAAV